MRFLLSAFLLLCASTACAATYYVRTDGGAPASCSGLVNAPYSSTVVNKACAIAHPMYLLPPNRDGNDIARQPLIAGGDTVMIAAGAYQFGLPFNGGGWGSCSLSWQYDCHMQPVPSGTAASPTQIIGAGSTSTKFVGSGGAAFVLNLTGSNYVLVQGIEITDGSNCIQNQPDAVVGCPQPPKSGPPVYLGPWAANGISDTEGTADNPASNNVTLRDINVHGMAKFGLNAGHIANWTLDHVRIYANGFGGWSLDTGQKSPSSGVNTITNSEIAWSGCTENYPTTAIWGCWSQTTGGYGDGVGSSSASDTGTWNFLLVNVHDNVQDGLDFLHADKTAIINYDQVTAAHNGGNQLKTSGTATITNSVVNGGCGQWAGVSDMTGNNSNSGATSADVCRAQGDTLQVSQSPGLTTLIKNNTIISQGNTHVTVPSTGFGDKTSKLNISNNILIGAKRWIQNDGSLPAIWWWGDNTPVNTPSVTGNVLFNINYGTCPAGNTCADPHLANQTLAAFDPTPTSATPPNVGAIRGTVTPPPPVCQAVCVPKVIYTMNANGHLDVSAGCGP
jgi:hypothetical protein